MNCKRILRTGVMLLYSMSFISSESHVRGNDDGFLTRSEISVCDSVGNSTDANATWTVPVVFHVIYNKESQNLPDSTLLASLSTLNSDFLGTNSDLSAVPEEFKKDMGIPNVKFELARKLPNGEPTSGIIRRRTSTLIFNKKRREMFGLSAIVDPKRHLNVYVCAVNSNGFTPDIKYAAYNAVVINYKKIGREFRTLTHEVGHWFSLKHIFKGDCSGKEDDGIADTPPQKKHKHYCPEYPKIECGNSTMFMNFMSYSTCRCFFTKGQVEHMRKYIMDMKSF